MLHLEETTETLEWLTETEALVGERKEKVTSQELKRSGLPSRWPVCRKQEDEKDRAETNVGGRTVINYGSSPFLLDSAVLTAGLAEPFLYHSS